MFLRKKEKKSTAVIVRAGGYVGVERRRKQRRHESDRRDAIRWPEENRRQNAGRRAADAPWTYR